jgi:hypothetical protein
LPSFKDFSKLRLELYKQAHGPSSVYQKKKCPTKGLHAPQSFR